VDVSRVWENIGEKLKISARWKILFILQISGLEKTGYSEITLGERKIMTVWHETFQIYENKMRNYLNGKMNNHKTY
jgi:hypothetical protein